MYNFILDQTKKSGIDRFKSEDLWSGPLYGLIENSSRSIEEKKVFVVTYKAFPPPFCEEIFEKYVENMRKISTSFTLLLTDDIDCCRGFFENVINGVLTGVLICSKETWKELCETNWFPFVRDLYEQASTVEQLGIEIEPFLGDFEALTAAGYQALSPLLKQKISRFDLSQLFFFPFLVKYCMSLGVKLDVHNFEIITNLLNSFVKCDDLAFPSFEVLFQVNSDEGCSILVRTPLKITQESLDMLKYQNVVTITDYLNLKILSFISARNPKAIYSENGVLILSKDFYNKLKQASELCRDPAGKQVIWFISRLFLESYFALGIAPQISDHQLSFHLWPVFPDDPQSVARFENSVIKFCKTLGIEIARKELDKVGDKIWEAKVPPVFLASHLLKVSTADQKEFLKTVVNEIALNVIKRWEENSLEAARLRNGQNLLKVSEILTVLHLLTDIADFDLIRNELNNSQSTLLSTLSQILSSSQGEQVSSKSSETFSSFAGKFADIYRIWEGVSSQASYLAEASSSYERVSNCAVDESGITSFASIWAINLRKDVENEPRGESTNPKKWNTLSKKYDELTQKLISTITGGTSVQFTQLHQTWKEALRYLAQMHTIFIIIADSMSMIDWYSIKDDLNLNDFKISEKFAVSTIPTETPVGHASIFSGLQPGECGVTGRTFLDKKGTAYELAAMEESSEDDTLLKKNAEYKYQPEHLRQILSSDNFQRKAIVISPFKGTRLTQTLKALISDQSEFLDLDYKEDRKFEDTTRLICEKIASMDRKRLLNKVVIVQFPNIDRRGHIGEWDEHIYFEKMGQEVNKLLQELRAVSKREKIHVGIILTSDHGKLLRWEINKIMSTLEKKDETASFSKVASIAKEELGNFSQLYPPVQSAKYLMGWLKDDVSKVSTKIISTVAEKTKMYLPSARNVKLFRGNEVAAILGRKISEKILCPNFFLVSLYEFGGGGKMQHSGLSLGELIIPYVYLEVEAS